VVNRFERLNLVRGHRGTQESKAKERTHDVMSMTGKFGVHLLVHRGEDGLDLHREQMGASLHVTEQLLAYVRDDFGLELLLRIVDALHDFREQRPDGLLKICLPAESKVLQNDGHSRCIRSEGKAL